MVSHNGRLGRAAFATGLALVVLTGVGTTGALWSDSAELEPGSLQAGNVQLTRGNSSVKLQSRQPIGSRTYESSTTCAKEGYEECRVITSTIAKEALIPGDRVVVTEKVTLAVQGNNLKGTLAVSPGPLTSSTLSRFSGSAVTNTEVIPPDELGTTTPFPVVASTNQGVGTYTIRSTIKTSPEKPDGSAWGTELQGQKLYEGAHTFTFTQTN